MGEERRKPGFHRRGPRYGNGLDPGNDSNIKKVLSDVEEKLKDSTRPELLNGLNSFERKLVHRHFDHDPNFETRTYRDGDNFKLFVYPVGNIKKFALDKADESLRTGEEIDLPPMGSYERFLVHAALQDIAGIETVSQGEGKDRFVRIVSRKFGRGLKKIAKKIRLI